MRFSRPCRGYQYACGPLAWQSRLRPHSALGNPCQVVAVTLSCHARPIGLAHLSMLKFDERAESSNYDSSRARAACARAAATLI